MKLMTCLFAILLAGNSWAQSRLKIKELSYNGSGCPLGSVGVNISDYNEAFTLSFSDYVAASDEPSDRRKNCQVALDVDVPQDYRLAIYGLQFRGEAFLDRKTSGIQSVRYNIDRNKDNHIRDMTLEGPYDSFYERAITIPAKEIRWFGCSNRPTQIRISSAVSVRAKEGQDALMTVDSLDGDSTQTYGVVWRPCRTTERNVTLSCKAELKKPNGRLVSEKILSSQGTSLKRAKTKMQKRFERKCQKSKQRRPDLNCSLIRSSCQVIRDR